MALALAVFVPKSCDIGAYFTGRLLGRHPLTPVLSPKKTREGAVGGLAIAALVAWALDQFGRTTDDASFWLAEMSDELAEANSPHRHADKVTTPMLVIHGDKDYRVPIGEALRLWWDLRSRSKADDGASPHKFLYFPDENHWIQKPNHVKVWYATVFAFLAHHVRGEDWQRPDLLG